MTKIYTKDFKINCVPKRRTWQNIAQEIMKLPLPGIPIRVILTSAQDDTLSFECSFIAIEKKLTWPSLLEINVRKRVSNRPFVAVSIVPTGVRAEIGGFAGDATPSTNLLAAACDYVVTNPNAVTASDVYFAKDNVLYLEGNLICQLLLGNIGIVPEKRTNIAAIIEKPTDERFLNNVLNALNGLRAVGGINIDPVIVTGGAIETKCTYSQYGNASGEFKGIEELIKALDVIENSSARAVALVSTLLVDDRVRQAYYKGESIPNPWGGAEAILTHTITNFYPFTAAHAPLLLELEHTGFGKLVDPRDGAELISSAYVCSPLSGLTNSPRPVSFDTPIAPGETRISVENISALVMPETTIGNIPFFAGLDQGVPIILVKDNITQYKITPELLQIPETENRKIYRVRSYMEAAGLLLALRNGILPESTTRPIPQLKPIFI
ncbi:hypothetical protein CEP10_14505 [Cylindrospermopsis raciborskii S07]|uniref:DUF3326 domain-containing protein n=2 Tax=Cylindrospermopsis raciborskii TaxID=77022 RepID=A0A853MJD7_9CYAN|nr:DUF3326 domain-containing protein [Cylindrospermopsis raciborskii]EFA70047.1 hypothetical protein CRC_01406 [Cylindrospermopsis raciborskii CS-505]OBU77208.1 hypothetical protein A9P98_13680 [Cylindrospermopsis raciborskii CS-505]OHY34257.1 hypothetical protein BCV63_04240 [Cylindrospermopsis raciborskii CS-508]PNK03887.1 hypothetical protein CEP10_14505 [Cylindrospermopsis raciborskii S07]PNK06767.1 hypothetical protein CEP11_06435 [Cylindrospermopsis raciborskii S10]